MKIIVAWSHATAPARAAIELLIRELPQDPMDAWAKLDAHYQGKTELRAYLDLWATTQSVTVARNVSNSTSLVNKTRA